MKKIASKLGIMAALASYALAGAPVFASNHMDAPLITLDPAANTTDVYAFRSDGGVEYLTTAVAVYPFEEPGIGPNRYNFDDNVLYQIHIALGSDVGAGRKTISYKFKFKTEVKNEDTILQSYLGVVNDVGDEFQNLTQTYKVIKVDHRTGRKTVLGTGIVPPNNQGLVTPFYNEGDPMEDGDNPAKAGVDMEKDLDKYTSQAIADLDDDYRAFAGQRDDGFYADIQSVFDLDFGFGAPRFLNKPFDSQGGFNLHTIVLNIPVSELGGDQQVVGVYATTSRRSIEIDDSDSNDSSGRRRGFVQVGRQGNPLFCEALVAIKDKDRYNRTSPTRDQTLFSQYAESPELAAALGITPIPGLIPAIYIPDLIKVDLSTGPARLAGGPVDDVDFSRLSVFGGDTLVSQLGDPVAGGWPNGRRFGDDVLDIALNALGLSTTDLDGVTENDISFNKVFPYAATPLNGRNHVHHGVFP